MKKTVFFSLVLFMFVGFTNNLAVETETWVLTPEERSLIIDLLSILKDGDSFYFAQKFD